MNKRQFNKMFNTTFDICMEWYNSPTDASFKRLLTCLKRWERKDYHIPEYRYTIHDNDPYGSVRGIVWHCSDRMNSGRAKAILRIIRDNRHWFPSGKIGMMESVLNIIGS